MGIIVLIIGVAFAVWLGSMAAKSTDVDKFKAGVTNARATTGYIVLAIVALSFLGYLLKGVQ